MINIDMKFLISLISNYKGDGHFILNLYKIYELCSRLCHYDLKKHKSLLDQKEDKIYTVGSHVLSEQERIALEIKRIYKACCSLKDGKSKQAYIQQLKDISSIINFDFDTKDDNGDDFAYLMAKQELSIMQAKLDLPISFLYAASMAFLDLYETEFINNQAILIDNVIFNKEKTKQYLDVNNLNTYIDNGKIYKDFYKNNEGGK